MKIKNAIKSLFKNIALAIYWITLVFGGICILSIAVSLSASLLDYLLNIAKIGPAFTSWTGKGALAVAWLMVAIKWRDDHKKMITHISQFTPEQHKEYKETQLKKNKASEARNDKIAILLTIGFILYLIGKSNLGYTLLGVFLEIIDKIFNHQTLPWIIGFYVFYTVIQALNQISNNIYHGIIEIKEKLDIIISQTE